MIRAIERSVLSQPLFLPTPIPPWAFVAGWRAKWGVAQPKKHIANFSVNRSFFYIKGQKNWGKFLGFLNFCLLKTIIIIDVETTLTIYNYFSLAYVPSLYNFNCWFIDDPGVVDNPAESLPPGPKGSSVIPPTLVVPALPVFAPLRVIESANCFGVRDPVLYRVTCPRSYQQNISYKL